MSKRVLIFSPELKDREEIAEILQEYFKRNFGNFYSQIEIQKYSMLREPVKDNQLGHWGIGETLVVFDRRLCSQKERIRSNVNRPYYKALKVAYEMSVGLCDKKEIPHVVYKGEIAQKKESAFIAELEKIRGKINGRLETKVQ